MNTQSIAISKDTVGQSAPFSMMARMTRREWVSGKISPSHYARPACHGTET